MNELPTALQSDELLCKKVWAALQTAKYYAEGIINKPKHRGEVLIELHSLCARIEGYSPLLLDGRALQPLDAPTTQQQ